MQINKLAEWLKVSSEHLFGILIFSPLILAFLVLAPDDWLTALGLRDLRDDYHTFLGLALLFSIAMVVVRGLAATSHWAKAKVVHRRDMKWMRQRLHSLTQPERDILRQYIQEDTRTQSLDIRNGILQGLAQARIIRRATNVSNERTLWAHNSQPWAWDYLNRNQSPLA